MRDNRTARAVAIQDVIVWILFLVIGIAVVAYAVLKRNPAPPPDPIPADNAFVPAFQMTDHNGQVFSHPEALVGHWWVVDFVFTNCAGPCPLMTAQMARIQDALVDLPNVRFVSISVDPNRDTPEVLKTYANEYGADLDTWTFLTGDYTQTQQLAANPFNLLVLRAEGSDDGSGNEVIHEGPILHSSKFVVVSPEGQIVDWFTGTEATDVERLLTRLRALAENER